MRHSRLTRCTIKHVVPERYTALSNDKKMLAILHRELERKIEKVKHMKLEVMPPKTKNNMNFQPE